MIGFDVLWNRMWSQYNRQFPVLIRLSIIASAFTIVNNFVSGESVRRLISQIRYNHLSSLVLAAWVCLVLVGLVITIWGSLALTFAIAKPDQAKTWPAAFQRGGQYFWPALTTGLLLLVILVGWTLLLVIPGIYFAVVYGLTNYVVVREDLKNMAALRRSAELVRGYWWAFFWRQLVFSLAYGFAVSLLTQSFSGLASHFGPASFMIGGVLTSIAAVLALPLLTILQAAIYDNLAVIKSSVTA